MAAQVKVRVTRVAQEARDVRAFVLESLDGAPLPGWTPGAHIDVHTPSGLLRQYSLVNGPGETHRYRIGVKREPASRGGSASMHERVRVGDTLAIHPPRNNFELRQEAAFHLLLAGGIGVTPLMSMARHLKSLGEPFRLHDFTRSPEDTPFYDTLSDPRFDGQVVFEIGLDPDGARDRLAEILAARPLGGHLYLCGPLPFMEAVEAAAAAAWPASVVHREYFMADPDLLAGPRASFRVRLARSGAEHEVPEGRSIVEVLAEAGVAVETSCEQGVCGTCLTHVLAGEPDHRDVYLTDAEKALGDQMCLCVSRARSPVLVLDL